MNVLVWVYFRKNISHVEKSGLLIVFHFGMIHKEYVDKQQTMLSFGDCTNMPLRQTFLE